MRRHPSDFSSDSKQEAYAKNKLSDGQASPLKQSNAKAAQEQKQIRKIILSLEKCLATEFLTDQERSNLEEAVSQLKQSLTVLPIKDS